MSKKFGCESVDAASSVVMKHMGFVTVTIKYEPRIILSVGEVAVSFTSKPSSFCLFSYISSSAGSISSKGPPVFVC